MMSKPITHDVQQGTTAWHALRAQHYTASEAAAMLGVSKYQSRADLLRQKATGIAPDVSDSQQRIFDRGHTAEADARPIAVEIIGEELYPCTVTRAVDGMPLLASCDGITLDDKILWEHKLINQELRQGKELDIHYRVQIEQQLLVTGAETCLFMASDGTEEDCVYVWYDTDPELRQRIIDGWEQFDEDLKNYQHVEPEILPVGTAPDTLPALRIELTGMVTSSNLDLFKTAALELISGVNTDLQTAQDFADAEKAIKWAKEVESKLTASKDHAISQTASIDELFRALDEIKETARTTRLTLEKLVKQRKESLKIEIVTGAKNKLRAHIDAINKTLQGVSMPEIIADFAGAIRGKKNLDSMRDAVDTELARSKIEANNVADKMRLNLIALADAGKEPLFPDRQLLVMKEPDDLAAIIKSRIADHEKSEVDRLEKEREKIRAEEETKARANAEAEAKQAAIQAEAKAKVEQDVHRPTEPAVTDEEFHDLVMEDARSRGMVSEKKPVDMPIKTYIVTVHTDKPDMDVVDEIWLALNTSGLISEVRPSRNSA
jgi:putative phage-type endonuclease